MIVRRVFDCFLYNGEIDVLTIRLHELNEVVDAFVIVEANQTHTGFHRGISFNSSDPRLSEFALKIRHVVVCDMPEINNPWVRDSWQRNAILRGVTDAAPTDLIIISDIDEIPRATIIAEMARDQVNEIFGVRLALSYFYVNYRNISGPEISSIWTVAATRRQLNFICPNDLRGIIRREQIPARIFDNGGWHFSYLTDADGIRKKIGSSTHQEYNTPEFVDEINIVKIVKEGQDLFNRPGYYWKAFSNCDLPKWLLANRALMSHLFYQGEKIYLPDVTLVVVDTVYHDMARMAIEDTCQGIEFSKVIVFTDRPEVFNVDEIVRVTATSVDEVGRILWYEVPKYITTSHVLIIQWDGWVINPHLWDNSWLEYDYIGAPWLHMDGLDVGNGGFSLRSKKLMELLATDSNFPHLYPEDDTICRKYRRDLEASGFKWPNRATAERFSFEYPPTIRSFGFHRFRNWPLVLTKEDLEKRMGYPVNNDSHEMDAGNEYTQWVIKIGKDFGFLKECA